MKGITEGTPKQWKDINVLQTEKLMRYQFLQSANASKLPQLIACTNSNEAAGAPPLSPHSPQQPRRR